MENHVIAAAIEFGTTRIGFAYSFKNEKDVLMSPISGSLNTTRGKDVTAPTVVLLNPDKSFHSFGYEAEEKFKELEKDGEADSWYYFEEFKMQLYKTKKFNRDVMLSDKGGKSVLAVDIFALVIGHLKKGVKEKIWGLQDDDILWVITVPAIWTDSAYEFMRDAAEKAGINKRHLKMVRPPEAAANAIKDEVCEVINVDGSRVFEKFPGGQKYLVADLGGGTEDLSVYEISPDRNIRELLFANGDANGEILVDKAFTTFLQNVFGEKVMTQLSEQHPIEWVDIQQSFDYKKSSVNKLNIQEPFNFRFPVAALSKIIKKRRRNQIPNRGRTDKKTAW